MEKGLQAVLDLLRAALLSLRAVYLFGSAAAGRLRDESDIDLAVLADRPLASSERLDLSARCARLLSRDVDLVDLYGASPVLLFQVLEGGQVLYRRDDTELAHFETTALARYCAWNEERRELVDDIVTRGSIHG